MNIVLIVTTFSVICMCMHKLTVVNCFYRPIDGKSIRQCDIWIAFLIVISIGMHLLDAREWELCILLLHFIVWFLPYLSEQSRLSGLLGKPSLRSWQDKLIVTSLIYLAAAIFAIYLGENYIATLCTFTCAGSVLYHRNYEMRFFNLDNIFATSLVVVFSYTLLSAFYVCQEFFIAGVLGLPLASFLLVYCGMPADITLNEDNSCCVRKSRPMYDMVHTLWHLVSGAGPLLSVLYFHSLRSGQHSLLGFAMERSPSHPQWSASDAFAMALSAVCAGVLVNVAGNLIGIMPLD